MRFIFRLILALTLLMIYGGAPLAQETDETDPQALLDAAVERLRGSDSFKLTISQTGEPYPLALTLDGVNTLPASLQNAEAQYITPAELHISALMRLFIPLSLDIYALDERQWISFPGGAPWRELPPFEGFDVNRLLAADDGIEHAMDNLIAPQLIAAEAPADDEEKVLTLEARAAGADISGLFFGFVEAQEDVEIVATITAADGRFAALEITMLETIGDPDKAPTVWHILFHDYDAPRDFDPPSP